MEVVDLSKLEPGLQRRVRRTLLRATQGDVAARAGISVSRVCEVETNSARLPAALLAEFRQRVDAALSELEAEQVQAGGA